MKRLMLWATTILFAFFMISCGGENTQNAGDDGNAGEETANTEETTDVDSDVLDLSAGEAIYTGKGMCSTCHQANGEGIEGTFPPLAGADYLLEDKTRAVKQAMYGSDSPITVNGVEYPGGAMTTVEMTDEEVRDVVNYILNSWGNEGGTVTAEDVKAAR